MSVSSHGASARSRNPLALPLIAVSVIAVAEAILVGVLVLRGPRAAGPAISTSTGPPAAQTADPQPPAAATRSTADAAPGVARGKRGQRVDSGGFGITVEEITDQPTLQNMARVNADERYLALLIAADNKTGKNATLYPSQFRLQDDRAFPYDPLNLRVKMPALPWQKLGNRETIRGYIDFVIPKAAKGLKLIYSGADQPIEIDLGE
jgi:Domain of unknown function (DUF4352)